jgi:flagellar biosynthesis protein FlhB
MADQGAQEKTEKPTPRRRSKAREEGRVARSQELGSAGVLLAGLASLWLFGGFMYDRITDLMRHQFTTIGQTLLNESEVHHFASGLMEYFVGIVTPVWAAVCVAAVLINLAQVGFMISLKRIKPDLKKINPLSGFKRFLSMRLLFDLAKNLGKLGLVAGVAYITMMEAWEELPGLVDMDTIEIFLYLMNLCLILFWRCLLAYVVLAVLDWAYQKWDFEKNLKMSKQEIKDEYKQTEGDPKVKSRIRSLQMEMSRKRMMAEVPQADVVITNPTHLAVALKYDAATMNAPEVVAKGANKLALRIKEIAKENLIPILEDKPLAQALYHGAEVGDQIPPDLFEAVATILAHVYRNKQQHQRVLDAARNRRGG